METQTVPQTASQSEAPAPAYAPPTASFVPLKLEERLGQLATIQTAVVPRLS